jgi:hypothetical protein
MYYEFGVKNRGKILEEGCLGYISRKKYSKL